MESKELAFFGKIAAGMTHELRNVLAIINESNGLMGDLMAMAKDSPMPYRDRFLKSISKIDEQVRRGVDISGKFNRFAHSVDHPLVSFDVNEVAEQSVGLARRFARLKNLELRFSASEGKVLSVTLFPFHFQMAITSAIEACMNGLDDGGVIHLKVVEEGGPRVDFTRETAAGETAALGAETRDLEVWRDLERVAGLLRAEIEWSAATGGFSVLLSPGPEEPKVVG